jgi:hypothetical protein
MLRWPSGSSSNSAQTRGGGTTGSHRLAISTASADSVADPKSTCRGWAVGFQSRMRNVRCDGGAESASTSVYGAQADVTPATSPSPTRWTASAVRPNS